MLHQAIVVLSFVAQGWLQTFPVDTRTLATTGENPYFILKPGYATTFEGRGSKLVITVLNETLSVGGVETRIVEEREWILGAEPIEGLHATTSRSIRSPATYYFGEDVDMHKKGKVVSHAEGLWESAMARMARHSVP
jgi:hypothetical protein